MVNARIVNNGSLDEALLDADNRNGISQNEGTGWSGFTIRSARSTGTDSQSHYIRHDDGTGPKLYASGTFTGSNNGAVARCDGTGSTGTWTIVGKTTAPFENFTKIRTLDLGSGPAIYAFGMFTDIFPVSANPISTGPVARWTGTDWVGLNAGTLTRNGTGGPVTLFVADMASFDDGTGTKLYATGPFDAIGGVIVRGFGRFNGSSWSAVGHGLNSFNDFLCVNPSALVVFDDDADGPVSPPRSTSAGSLTTPMASTAKTSRGMGSTCRTPRARRVPQTTTRMVA